LVIELRDDSIALRYLASLSMESGLCFNSIVMVVVTIPSHMWSSLTDTPCCAQLFLLLLQLLDWSSFLMLLVSRDQEPIHIVELRQVVHHLISLL
jgi:hypothetical protein